MKHLLLIAALMCGNAWADLVATNGPNELRLIDSACTHEGILENIKPEYRDKFKRAQATVGNKTFAACWIDTGEGAYWVAFENGQSVAFSVTGFINQPGV
jgi:hypothetical protein